MALVSDLITSLREDLEDFPVEVNDQYTTADTTTTKIQLAQFPVHSVTSVTVNAVAKVETTDWTLDYNTGLLTLVAAPGSGQLVDVVYKKCIFRDARFLTAIQEAVRAMWDKVYLQGVAYVAVRSQVGEYDLTNSTDVPASVSWYDTVASADQTAARSAFANPLTRIMYAELLRYGGLQADWQPFLHFERRETKRLFLTTDLGDSDLLRIVYITPCTVPSGVGSTLDVPDAYIDLPRWFVLGTLMRKKESVRDRAGGYAQVQNVNSVAPTVHTRTGIDYMAQFYATLRDRPMSPLRRTTRRTASRA